MSNATQRHIGTSMRQQKPHLVLPEHGVLLNEVVAVLPDPLNDHHAQLAENVLLVLLQPHAGNLPDRPQHTAR